MKLTRSHALLFGAALLFAVQGASSLLASDKHYVSAAEVKRNTEIVMSKIAWTNELVLNTARGHFTTGLSPGAYRVTVRIPVSAIREFADGDSDLQSLRERSEITRYRVPTGTTLGGWRTR